MKTEFWIREKVWTEFWIRDKEVKTEGWIMRHTKRQTGTGNQNQVNGWIDKLDIVKKEEGDTRERWRDRQTEEQGEKYKDR